MNKRMVSTPKLSPFFIANINRGKDHIKHGIYTLGICFFQKEYIAVEESKDFFARKKADKAKKIGTAQFKICLTTIRPQSLESSHVHLGKVCIPTTIIMANPRTKSKYPICRVCSLISLTISL